MATTDPPHGTRRDEPISALLRSLIADALLLARGEAELAKIELKDKVAKAGGAAGLMAGGLVFALYGVAVLVATAVLALAIVLPAWAAALIVGLVLLAVATALVLIGRARFRSTGPLSPTATIANVQEDIAWIRLRTAQLKTSE